MAATWLARTSSFTGICAKAMLVGGSLGAVAGAVAGVGSGFWGWLATLGAGVGAVAGLGAGTSGLVAHRLTHSPSVTGFRRRLIVTVASAVGATTLVGFVLFLTGGFLVAQWAGATAVLTAAAAFVLQPALERRPTRAPSG